MAKTRRGTVHEHVASPTRDGAVSLQRARVELARGKLRDAPRLDVGRLQFAARVLEAWRRRQVAIARYTDGGEGDRRGQGATDQEDLATDTGQPTEESHASSTGGIGKRG